MHTYIDYKCDLDPNDLRRQRGNIVMKKYSVEIDPPVKMLIVIRHIVFCLVMLLELMHYAQSGVGDILALSFILKYDYSCVSLCFEMYCPILAIKEKWLK